MWQLSVVTASMHLQYWPVWYPEEYINTSMGQYYRQSDNGQKWLKVVYQLSVSLSAWLK